MAYEWQTVESAAVTLGVSTRTLARRISEGKIESRLENGRREVLVCLPDAPAEPEPAEDADREMEFEGQALAPQVYPAEAATALALAEDRLTSTQDRLRSTELTVTAFRQTAEMAHREMRRASVGALWAWGTVAAMAAGIVAVTGWTTAKVTRSQAQAEYLEQRMAAATSDAERAAQAQTDLRRQVEQARIAAAKAEGQLEAVQAQARQAASRQAPSLFNRIASVLDEHANAHQ
jgi:hypothetical protein